MSPRPGALDAVPAEIRDKPAEWVDMAARQGPGVVARRLAEQSAKVQAEFDSASAAVERLLREL